MKKKAHRPKGGHAATQVEESRTTGHSAADLKQSLVEMGVPVGRFQGRQSRPAVRERAALLEKMFGGEAAESVKAPLLKTRRRGVSVSPIKQSLRNPDISAASGQGARGPVLSLWFSGARVLTVNELFSIFQFRKFETYQYKAQWKKLIQDGVDSIRVKGQEVPYFDGPTRLVLYRRGAKYIDLDSFPAVFKYAIDGLRKAGVLQEDDPLIVVETHPVQRIGEPSIGLRLERLLDWKAEEEVDTHLQWFGHHERLDKGGGDASARKAGKSWKCSPAHGEARPSKAKGSRGA